VARLAAVNLVARAIRNMMLNAYGEKLCSGCPRPSPPAGYFVSPAQSCPRGGLRFCLDYLM